MIAPLKDPAEQTAARRRNHALSFARRIVAAALLSADEADRGPRVPGWQAWLFAFWMTLAAVAYALAMVGASWF
ncbi:MAG TPA: hypothetical protein VMV10_02465 [Pirellulales bacterium]|nr:hypothetical protein [Pirellulales bacterium]